MSNVSNLVRQIRSLPFTDMMLVAEEIRSRISDLTQQKIEAVVLANILSRLQEGESPIMTPTLEDKLAMMVWYLEEVRQHRRGADPKAFESYLDDSEVVMWLDKMNKANRIRNTRFTDKR